MSLWFKHHTQVRDGQVRTLTLQLTPSMWFLPAVGSTIESASRGGHLDCTTCVIHPGGTPHCLII